MTHVEVVSAELTSNALKDRLAQIGMSQEDAARRVGISYRHFNRIVLMQAEPTLLVSQMIATVVGKPVSKLFTIAIKTRPRDVKA